MKIRKLVATAGLTIAAMAITGGTSYAAPEPTAEDVQSITHLAGDQGGIHYDTIRSDADKTVSTTLSGGTFVLTDAGVQVLNAAGVVTTTAPIAITDGTNMVALQPKITEGGTTLVATPIFEPIRWDCSPSSPRSRSIETGAGLASMVGAFAGGIVGIAIAVATMGIGIIALPFTALIGALIGLAVGGAAGAAVPNSDKQDAWECSGP
ncbi:hypothetical protein [Nocardia aurantiaca]|uniref:DUF8020 domain-containing protein n=1 Tax=Nocardia aurantiaca TaxID=2675850 RepID=A0A6I3L8P0_9NOCA|nr:hypothetical protein [Nocardia aurantiaca]MTE16626.1 hypothetical protein [Nocardia aurantiaca]